LSTPQIRLESAAIPRGIAVHNKINLKETRIFGKFSIQLISHSIQGEPMFPISRAAWSPIGRNIYLNHIYPKRNTSLSSIVHQGNLRHRRQLCDRPRFYQQIHFTQASSSSFFGKALFALTATFIFYQIFGKSPSCEAQEDLISNEEALPQAIMDGDVAKATSIVNKIRNTPQMYVKDDQGRNYLHLAVIQGNEAMVDLFLQKGVFSLNEDVDDRGLNALHWAIHEGHEAIIVKLLNSGATLVPSQGRDTPTYPLEMAVAAGNPKIFDILIEQDTTRQIDSNRQSPLGNLLHIAIHSNQNFMLEHLLTVKREDIKSLLEARDPHGRTPLQLAAFLGDCRAIELLIKLGEVNINRGEGEKGGTTLHYAAERHHLQAIVTLDYYNARISAVDEKGRSPQALIESHPEFEAMECKKLLVNFSRTRMREKTLPPNFNKRPPYNLVFQGGGPRGIAYVGALKEMEAKEALSELRRVAGTSAGAITAALLAVGYSADEIEKELKSLDFKTLLDAEEKNQGWLDFIWNSEQPDPLKRGAALVIQDYWDSLKKDPLHPVNAAKKLAEQYYQTQGLCQGEKLREIVERMIYDKTKENYLTFGELRQRVRDNPAQYKHLYVVATRLTGEEQVLDTFSSEEMHEDAYLWEQLIISDAVRASSSIPGVFNPHVLHYKDPINGRQPRSSSIKYVDGGLIRNYPLDIFDDKKYQEDPYNHGKEENRRTLGFSLFDPTHNKNSPPASVDIGPLNTASDIAQALFLTFYHAEEILRKHQGSTGRTVAIPVALGLKESFGATSQQKEEMIDSGKSSAGFFFR
jgi:predicted acylesterase/phospholipase RssA/ankyrin repeat protein